VSYCTICDFRFPDEKPAFIMLLDDTAILAATCSRACMADALQKTRSLGLRRSICGSAAVSPDALLSFFIQREEGMPMLFDSLVDQESKH